MQRRRPVVVPRPDRVRRVPRGFGWVDHRLMQDGHLAWLKPVEAALYLFLVLAADHRGVSFYRLESISRALGHLDWCELGRARRRLVDLGLIAYEPWTPHAPNGVYQVLGLDGLPGRRLDDAR